MSDLIVLLNKIKLFNNRRMVLTEREREKERERERGEMVR